MKTPNRTVSIFTLSALDVLAMATGVFVLLVVMMMPYYRMTFDAGAEMDGVRVSVSALHAEIEAERRAAAGDAEAAGETIAAAAAAEAEATRKREAASRLRAQVAAAPPPPTVSPEPGTGDVQVVNALDLVFVVDASGSMGPVLTELSRSIGGIARVLEKMIPSLRVGIIAYRDRDVGSWVTSDLPLTPTRSHLATVVNFAAGLRPATVGGGTVTEAVLAGLERASAMPFRPGAKHQIIVIGDAAAHPNEQGPALALARNFAAGGPRRSVSALFVTTPAYQRFGQGDREFFARLADAGGGTFSDHRGELLEAVLLSVLEG